MRTTASASHALVSRSIHCELCIGINQQTQLSHHLCHFSPFNKCPHFFLHVSPKGNILGRCHYTVEQNVCQDRY